MTCLAAVALADMLAYNVLVVAAGTAAVGFAAGVVGSLCVLRKRALVGDAAAHATLVGVAAAFGMTGRRDLPVLLGGALVAALVSLGVLVLLRRFTRTRDDAATAIVLAVGFGAGIAMVAGMNARGLPGSAGLEQFLLGHAAALTLEDALLLGGVSLAAVLTVVLLFKEFTLVAFDMPFAAAAGWPVTAIDYLVVVLMAVMVVIGLPAVGAVLVTALVVIPPVAARQWTDRVGRMLLLAGVIGLVAAVAGVAGSAAVPRLATGPMIVLVAAAIFVVSFVLAPRRGWLARWMRQRRVERAWAEGRILAAAWTLAGRSGGTFTHPEVVERLGGSSRRDDDAWAALVRGGMIAPASSAGADGDGEVSWRLSESGRGRAAERAGRLALWADILAVAPEDARAFLTIDVPSPEDVIEPARLAEILASSDSRGHS